MTTTPTTPTAQEAREAFQRLNNNIATTHSPYGVGAELRILRAFIAASPHPEPARVLKIEDDGSAAVAAVRAESAAPDHRDHYIRQTVEACAQQVDHILKAGGGTYGDYLRRLVSPLTVKAESAAPAVSDEAVEAAARALCVSRGLNPDCLHNGAGGNFPADEYRRGHDAAEPIPQYRSWRKQVPHARAVMDAAFPALTAQVAALVAENEKYRNELAWANNSFGSQTADWPGVAVRIEDVKKYANEQWRRAEAAEQRLATAIPAIATLKQTRDDLESQLGSIYDLLRDFDNTGSGDVSVCAREILRQVSADMPRAIAEARRKQLEAEQQLAASEAALRELEAECDSMEGLGSEQIAKAIRAILAARAASKEPT